MSSPIILHPIDRISNSYRYQKTEAAAGSGPFRTALQAESGKARALRTTDVFQLTEAQQVSTSDMTLPEYKNYIQKQIDSIPLHPSQALCSISVQISDAGFEAMQKDPEYEKWVLDTLRYNFSFNDPWTSICGGSYSTHYFGATKEAYHGCGWYEGYRDGKGREVWEDASKDSFWTRKVKREKENMELFQKSQRQRELLEARSERAAMQRKALSAYFGQVQYSRSLAARSGSLFAPDMPFIPSVSGGDILTGVSAAELLEVLL